MKAIYSDHFVTLGTAASIAYSIQHNGATIYEGVAVRRPGAAEVSVRINDICADYLRQTLPDFTMPESPIFKPSAIVGQFKTYAGATLKDTVDFIADYSYSGADTFADLHAPITGEYAAGLPVIYSVPTARTIEADEEEVTATGAGNFTTNASQIYDQLRGVAVNFPRVNVCGGYVLLYANALGGWDELITTGRAIHSRDYERLTIGKEREQRGDDETPANEGAREKRNYMNIATDKWQLYTGFLTDAQAARMHHLIGSTNVWLIRPEAFSIEAALPVVITVDECADKTYDNNGRQLVYYSITAELAQQRIRR